MKTKWITDLVKSPQESFATEPHPDLQIASPVYFFLLIASVAQRFLPLDISARPCYLRLLWLQWNATAKLGKPTCSHMTRCFWKCIEPEQSVQAHCCCSHLSPYYNRAILCLFGALPSIGHFQSLTISCNPAGSIAEKWNAEFSGLHCLCTSLSTLLLCLPSLPYTLAEALGRRGAREVIVDSGVSCSRPCSHLNKT